MNRCPVLRQNLLDKVELLEKENSELKREIYNLKEEINRLKTDAELRIELARKDSKLEFMQQTQENAEKLQNHILKENSKPRSNITINMSPFDFSKEKIEEICNQYTADHFIAGSEATYKFILDKHMKAEDGRPRVKCTDSSRRIFKGIKEDGTEFTDVGGRKIAAAVTIPMKKVIKNIGNNLDDLTDEEYCKKISSHHRALEPARLTKRLASDLNDVRAP